MVARGQNVFVRQDTEYTGSARRQEVAGVQKRRLEGVRQLVAIIPADTLSPRVQEAVLKLFQLRKYPDLAQNLHLLNEKLQ